MIRLLHLTTPASAEANAATPPIGVTATRLLALGSESEAAQLHEVLRVAALNAKETVLQPTNVSFPLCRTVLLAATPPQPAAMAPPARARESAAAPAVVTFLRSDGAIA